MPAKVVFRAMFDFQAADQGEYQCLAESEAGTAERTITLKVQSEFFHMRNNYTLEHICIELYSDPPRIMVTVCFFTFL